MSSPLATVPAAVDPIEDEFRQIYGPTAVLNESELFGRELGVADLSEQLAERRLTQQVASYAQQYGQIPDSAQQRLVRDQLQQNYFSQLNARFAAQKQAAVKAAEQDREDDVGLIGATGRIVARGALEFASGGIELVTGVGDIAEAQLGVDLPEIGLGALRDGVQSVREQLVTPGQRRAMAELDETREAYNAGDIGVGELVTGTLSSLASGDGVSLMADQLVSGLALIAGAGKLVGASRAATTVGAKAVARNQTVARLATRAGDTATMRRLSDTAKAAARSSPRLPTAVSRGLRRRGAAVGNVAAGAGVVIGARTGREAREAVDALGDEIYASPAFTAHVTQMEAARGVEMTDTEARESFARQVEANAQIMGGASAALMTFLAPSTEAAFMRYLGNKTPTTGSSLVSGQRARIAAGEAVAEGVEEAVQTAAPDLAAGFDVDAAGVAQGAMMGAILGGVGGAVLEGARQPSDAEAQAFEATLPQDTPPAGDSETTGLAQQPRDQRVQEGDGQQTSPLDTPTQGDVANRTAVARAVDRTRRELGFAASQQLASLHVREDRSPAQQAEYEALLREEQANNTFSTRGAIQQRYRTTTPAVEGLTDVEARAFRDLRASRISLDTFIDQLGGTSVRVLELAEKAQQARDFPSPQLQFDVTPEGEGSPADLGPIALDALQDEIYGSFEMAQIDNRVRLAQLENREVGGSARFGVGAFHPEGAIHPTEQFQTYYSEPGRVSYAINTLDGEIEFKPEGGQWTSIDEATAEQAQSAMHTMAIAAVEPGDVPNNDALLAFVDRFDGRVFGVERRATDQRVENFDAAQATFTAATAQLSSAANEVRAQFAQAQEEYVQSDQAFEAWAQQLSTTDGITIPAGVENDAGSARRYLGAARRKASEIAQRLGDPFVRETPAARTGAIRSSLSRQGFTVSGGPQINAFIRSLGAQPMTPADRVRFVDNIVSGEIRDLPGTAREPEAVRLDDPDQFSPQDAQEFLRTAEAVRDQAIREARMARVAGKLSRFAPGDAAAFGEPIRGDVIDRGASPLASPTEATAAAQALAEAVVRTPGNVNVQVPIPRDEGLNLVAAEAAPLIEEAANVGDVDAVISQVDSLPFGTVLSGELDAVRSAAASLKATYDQAPPPPVAGIMAGRAGVAALHQRIGRVQAMTGRAQPLSTQGVLSQTHTVGDLDAPSASEQVASLSADLNILARQEAMSVALGRRDVNLTLDPFVSEELTTQLRAAAPSLSNAEISQVIQDAATAPDGDIAAITAEANNARTRADIALDKLIDLIGGGDGQFKLGARVENPMDRSELDGLVQEKRDAFKALGVKFVVFDSMERYREIATLERVQPGMAPEVQDAIRSAIKNTPDFSARWQPPRDGGRGGVVQVVADTFADAGALDRAMSHELVAHYRLVDLIGPNAYERLRSLVLTATQRRDPEVYKARERVLNTLTDAVMAAGDMQISRARARQRLRDYHPDLIANEVLADMAERGEAKRGGMLDEVRKVFVKYGLSRKGQATDWIRTLLRISRDSLDVSAGGRVYEQSRIKMLRNGLEALEEDAPSPDLVRERGLLNAYRRLVNSEINFQTIEQAVVDSIPDALGLRERWRTVRERSEQANNRSNVYYKRNLANYKDVMRAASTMRNRSGMTPNEFDRVLDGYLTARDAIDRHRFIVLSKMPAENNPQFEQARAEIKGAARNAPSRAVAARMLDQIEAAARSTGANDILNALRSDSPVWEATVGETYAELDNALNGPTGQRVAKLIEDTRNDEVSFDGALDALRASILEAQIESGSYGTKGANMVAAAGIRHYVPQLGVEDPASLGERRRLFQANDPVFAALKSLGDSPARAAASEAAFDMMSGKTGDAGFLTDPEVLPRSAFNVALQGRRRPSTVMALKAFERRAYTSAYEVGTAEAHRALLDAVSATQQASEEFGVVSNAAGLARVERNIDLGTKEAREAFEKAITSGRAIAVYDRRGDPTLVHVESPQLLQALTDRFITQAHIETTAFSRTVGSLTRFYGRSLTSWNPFFVTFRQFPRDLWEAAVVTGFERELGVRGAASVVSEGMGNLRRLAGYYFADTRDQVEKLAEYRKAPAGSWEREFAHFIDNGGEQTFTQQFADPVRDPRGLGENEAEPSAVERTLAAARRAVRETTGVDPVETQEGQSRADQIGQRVEGFTNLHDNAVRFALYNAVRQQAERSGVGKQAARERGVDVSRNLMPFNRRSALARRMSPYYVFVNSAIASLSANIERRIWRGGELPIETTQLANGQREVRLRSDWARQLNAPMVGAMALKGFASAWLATAMLAGDDEEETHPQDVVPAGTLMDGIVLPGALSAGRRGEALPAFVPEQLGITGMAHAVGASVAALMQGYDPADVRISLTNALAKNASPLNLNITESNGSLGALVQGLMPTIFHGFVALGFNTDAFGQPIEDYRDERTRGDNFRPSTGANYGLVEALRAVDEAAGVDFDPGQAEFLIRQFGVFGQLALSTLDQLGRSMSGEPSQIESSVARATGLLVNTAQYGTVRGYYRYKNDYLDQVHAAWKAANRDDEDAGDVGPGQATFAKERIGKMGPRAREIARGLPDEFWEAKVLSGRVGRQVSQIKKKVDIARSNGRGDEATALMLQEQAIYREALEALRGAFDDGRIMTQFD